MSQLVARENILSILEAGELSTSIMFCYQPLVSKIGVYPDTVTVLGARQRLVSILKLELPAPQTTVDHVLITLSGDYLITLNGEYLAYV